MKPKILITIFMATLIPSLTFAAANPGDVLINEIAWMGTTVSANDEWLELYNPSAAEIDLTGWILEASDGSPKINLTGKIAPAGYFLLERTDDSTVASVSADQIYSGSMGNDGEWLKLYDNANNLIDQIDASAGWPAGENENKKTMEKSEAGWQNSLLPDGTPKTQNSIATSTEENPVATDDESATENSSTQDTAASSASSIPPAEISKISKGELIINEILPNPQGPDSEKEFIELKNISNRSLDLTGCQIKNSNQQKFSLAGQTLAPQAIMTFYRKDTKLILNNNKEKVSLWAANNKLLDEISYKTAALEDKSFQKNPELDHPSKTCWDKPTPEKENYCDLPILPMGVISGPNLGQVNQFLTFDGSDSYDPKNRDLKFIWSFGDGRVTEGAVANQIYLRPGNYEILLKVMADEKASSTEKLKIKIQDIKTEAVEKENSTTTSATSNINSTTTEAILFNQSLPNIFISEFLPDPKTDENNNEFIELFSEESYPYDLGGLYLDDAANKTKPYQIPAGTVIKPNQYLAFFRSQTKVALNNDQDQVRFLTKNNQIIDQANYQKAKPGVSLVRDENYNWQSSQTPTPNETNVIDSPKTEEPTQPTSTSAKVLGVELDNNIPNQSKNKLKRFVDNIFETIGQGLKNLFLH